MSKSQISEYISDMRSAGDQVTVVISDSDVVIKHANGVVERHIIEQSEDCISSTLTSWRN